VLARVKAAAPPPNFGVGSRQGRSAAAQQVELVIGSGRGSLEQRVQIVWRTDDSLDHSVMNQRIQRAGIITSSQAVNPE